MVWNLIVIMYILKKEEILNKKTGDDEVIYQGQSEEPLLLPEEQSLVCSLKGC